MRAIDADALKEAHGMKDDCADCDKELRGKSRSCEFERLYTLMDFCGWLDDTPTIEPERKTGRWMEKNVIHEVESSSPIDEWQSAKCSVCGKYHTTPYLYYFDDYSFCPNCGADMRGEQP